MEKQCFNSNMVRLKGSINRKPKACYICFNSNMVRLKVCILNNLIISSYVSIPIWFD